MESSRKPANTPTGNDDYEQMIAERSNFHPPQATRSQKAPAKPPLIANRPAGTDAYEQRIAESHARMARHADE